MNLWMSQVEANPIPHPDFARVHRSPAKLEQIPSLSALPRLARIACNRVTNTADHSTLVLQMHVAAVFASQASRLLLGCGNYYGDTRVCIWATVVAAHPKVNWGEFRRPTSLSGEPSDPYVTRACRSWTVLRGCCSEASRRQKHVSGSAKPSCPWVAAT
jgi:hypothetical protein